MPRTKYLRLLRLLGCALLPLPGYPGGAAPTPEANVQPLLAGWRFRQVGQAKWLPATVPGCVRNRDNELKQQ